MIDCNNLNLGLDPNASCGMTGRLDLQLGRQATAPEVQPNFYLRPFRDETEASVRIAVGGASWVYVVLDAETTRGGGGASDPPNGAPRR